MFSGALRGKTVALLGLTFKPNTDDMREAPSLAIISALQDMGAQVRAYDPAGMRQAQELLKDVTYCESAYDCAEAADALVIATEWEQFRALDLGRLHDLMACPVVVDLRNIYRPADMHNHGFAYACVGKSSTAPGLAPDALLDQLSPIARVRTSAPACKRGNVFFLSRNVPLL